MFKFVTIYRRVDDPNAIDQFFSETHLPLSEALPNLVRSEVSWVRGKPGGESRFYMQYELYFESEESWQMALLSEPGVALVRALKPWGDEKILTWFYSETYEETHENEAG